MSENKTRPTDASVEHFLSGQPERRQAEAATLIELMRNISGVEPVLWGPSIIGFGSVHYRYATGREGDMPVLAFSPRKAKLTIYFSEGFDHYETELAALGTHTHSVSCLYVNKLADVDLRILEQMLKACHLRWTNSTMQ